MGPAGVSLRSRGMPATCGWTLPRAASRDNGRGVKGSACSVPLLTAGRAPVPGWAGVGFGLGHGGRGERFYSTVSAERVQTGWEPYVRCGR